MASKSKLAALLTGDQRRLGELALAAGEVSKAADHFAKAGDHVQAVQVAVQAGSEQRAIRYGFKAALGAKSAVPQGATARQAGDMLKTAGLLEESMLLFELASAYGQAAEVATKLKQPVKAAELYERAGDWGRAAIYFESSQKWQDAIRMLGLQSRTLAKRIESTRDPDAVTQKREADDRRAALLARLGRREEAARLVVNQEATPQSAELLWRSGRAEEAFEAFLGMGDASSANNVLESMVGLTAERRAHLLQRCGRVRDAAQVLSEASLPHEAAHLFEQENLWMEAAKAWEAADNPMSAAAAYRKAESYDSAARCFTQAGRPDFAAEAYALLGRHSDAITFYLKAGKPAEAAAEYERNHQYTEAATYYLHADQKALAIQALEKVRPGAEDFFEATIKVVPLMLEAGKLKTALARVRQVPDDPHQAGNAALDRLYWEGRCLEAYRQQDAALACYKRLEEIDPKYPQLAERLQAFEAMASPVQKPAPPSSESIEDLLPGVEIAGRYQLKEELGRGGMGRVFRAYDNELKEDVAVKALLAGGAKGPADEERLIREVQICRKLTHANIVRIYDIGRYGGGLFVTMEFLVGHDLAQEIKKSGALDLSTTKTILCGVLDGLRAAHSQEVVHRDLKPQNIFLSEGRPKLLDFGIAHAKNFDTRLTVPGHAIGTPLYMAPEQIQGKTVDSRSDLYAVGIVTYEMLTGRGPFDSDNAAAIAVDHLQTPPRDIRELRPELPETWAQFVHRLLAKEPDLRLPSAGHALNVAHALPSN